MSTHSIGFYEDLTKLSLNYHQISSNTRLISSAVTFLLLVVISPMKTEPDIELFEPLHINSLNQRNHLGAKQRLKLEWAYALSD